VTPFNVDTPDIEKDIFDTPADNALAKQEAKKLLLSDGWYITEDLSFTPETYDDGRRVARYFGTIINRKDPAEQGKIGFRFSPDLRPDAKNPERADWNYRMFLQARKAFIAATGSEPVTNSDVANYVAQYPVALRIRQTDADENMVVAIAAVKE
jgi:hypothetical protein